MEDVRSRHLGCAVAEPTFVIAPFANLLQVRSRSPVPCTNLRRCPCDGVPGAVEAGLLREQRGNLLRLVVGRVLVPRLLRRSETIRDLELEVRQGMT